MFPFGISGFLEQITHAGPLPLLNVWNGRQRAVKSLAFLLQAHRVFQHNLVGFILCRIRDTLYENPKYLGEAAKRIWEMVSSPEIAPRGISRAFIFTYGPENNKTEITTLSIGNNTPKVYPRLWRRIEIAIEWKIYQRSQGLITLLFDTKNRHSGSKKWKAL